MADDEVREVRQFKGLWIPAVIIQWKGLTAVDKMLWADIDSFSGNGTTWFKSRARVANELGVSRVTISRSLTTLRNLQLVVMTKNDGRVVHYVSTLPHQDDASPKSRSTGQPNQYDTIDNKRDEQPKKQQRFKPPHLEDVRNYFAERGMLDGEEPEKFHDYYTANGWTQGRGKPIRDWKAAARNWMKNVKQFSTTKKGFRPDNFSPDGIGSFIANG